MSLKAENFEMKCFNYSSTTSTAAASKRKKLSQDFDAPKTGMKKSKAKHDDDFETQLRELAQLAEAKKRKKTIGSPPNDDKGQVQGQEHSNTHDTTLSEDSDAEMLTIDVGQLVAEPQPIKSHHDVSNAIAQVDGPGDTNSVTSVPAGDAIITCVQTRRSARMRRELTGSPVMTPKPLAPTGRGRGRGRPKSTSSEPAATASAEQLQVKAEAVGSRRRSSRRSKDDSVLSPPDITTEHPLTIDIPQTCEANISPPNLSCHAEHATTEPPLQTQTEVSTFSFTASSIKQSAGILT